MLVLVCVGAAPAGASPLLSEVFYDADGADDGYGFVELAGEPGETLDGLSLAGVNGYNGALGPVIELEGVIGPDGLFLVADLTADGSTYIPHSDLLANFDFQNGPDSVVLFDGETVLDAVGYGDFAVDEFFAGEGNAAFDAPAGSSLARVFADLDTGDNATDFVVLDLPTPGSAVFQPIPEPGAGLLFVCGLACLGQLRRRSSRASHKMYGRYVKLLP